MTEFPALAHAISLLMAEDECDATTAARTLRGEAADNDTSMANLVEEIVVTTTLTATGQEVKGLVATRREVAILREEVAELSDAVHEIRGASAPNAV